MGLNSSDIFDSYKIKTLIDNLGRIQREIIDKGCHIAYQLHSGDGKRFWLSAEGVNVAVWDSNAVAYGDIFPQNALHIRFGLTPSEFVRFYVTDSDDVRKIADAISVKI
jgi:hypothetical protein